MERNPSGRPHWTFIPLSPGLEGRMEITSKAGGLGGGVCASAAEVIAAARNKVGLFISSVAGFYARDSDAAHEAFTLVQVAGGDADTWGRGRACMRVPNESIVLLEKITGLPGDWLREWAAGAGVRSNGPAILVNKVNLDVLPGLSRR